MGPTLEKNETGEAGGMRKHQGWIRRFFFREDPIYDHYAAIGQAKSPRAKAFYLLMHLLPGITGWALINVSSIYYAQLRFTGFVWQNIAVCLAANRHLRLAHGGTSSVPSF
jgi:hypothetical protein